MTTLTHAPETKAASGDLALAFEDLRYTLESYRLSNDQRLAEVETRRGADPLTEEKMARMDAALDEAKSRIDRLTLDRARPALGQGRTAQAPPRSPSTRPHSPPISATARPVA